MGSARLLKLFHTITPFGGIQVLAVGDFLQLKPVLGAMMFHSQIFPKLFPHMIELTVIHRVEEGKESFKSVLRELSISLSILLKS